MTGEPTLLPAKIRIASECKIKLFSTDELRFIHTGDFKMRFRNCVLQSKRLPWQGLWKRTVLEVFFRGRGKRRKRTSKTDVWTHLTLAFVFFMTVVSVLGKGVKPFGRFIHWKSRSEHVWAAKTRTGLKLLNFVRICWRQYKNTLAYFALTSLLTLMQNKLECFPCNSFLG
jgi:hypothetical protein